MLRNLLCWFVKWPARFPLWLLSGDQVEINGRVFVYQGRPRRFQDEARLVRHFGADNHQR
jgi:hypothetical protein